MHAMVEGQIKDGEAGFMDAEERSRVALLGAPAVHATGTLSSLPS